MKAFLRVYLITWGLLFALFLFNFFGADISFIELIQSFGKFSTSVPGLIFTHSFVLIFYLLFLITRYFIRVYRKRGSKIFAKHFIIRFIIPLLILFFSLTSLIRYNNSENFDYKWDYSVENKSDTIQNLFAADGMHRGVTVYNLGRSNRTNIDELIKNNIEWVVILPYFYQETQNTNTIRAPKEIGVWSHRDSMFIASINSLHQKKIKIHLKPHLWMSSGWRSNIYFDNDNDWNTWFASYRKTILHYATMAQKTNTELFCIGTELRNPIKHQPEKWKSLVKDIKSIYKGKLTYAANWDGEFNDVPFWNNLDYIGIQAYFPLTEKPTTSLEEIKNGWKKYIQDLEKLSEKYEKKILFTEVGYRPDKNATTAPWEWGSSFDFLLKRKSKETQYIAFEALYSELWLKDWFAGTYIWQWNNSDFEVKNYPAQNSIAKWYAIIKK